MEPGACQQHRMGSELKKIILYFARKISIMNQKTLFALMDFFKMMSVIKLANSHICRE